MTYLDKNFLGKECYIVFMDRTFYRKVQIQSIDSMGICAFDYKTTLEKYERKSRFDMTIPEREFTKELDFNLIFYPWTAIRELKKVPENE